MCDDCCCCNRWDDWKCCLICFGAIAAIVLIVVLSAAYGFVLQPAFTVEDASLARFNLSSPPAPTSLAYNLSITLTARNRNWAMAIKNTKPLEAAYKFDGQMFDRVLLADKGRKQGAGKTVVYRLATSSENAYAALGNAGVVEYRKERAAGTFEVEVAVTGEVRYTARITKCKIEATCPLKLQLTPPGTPAVAFQKVKCKLAKAEKNC